MISDPILDPHVVRAILALTGALLAALVLWCMHLAEQEQKRR